MDLGYQNPFYLKQAQQKQQSLYNGKVLLEKHNPPAVYDSEETLQLESRLKIKQLNKEIKPVNYAKINHLLGVSVSETTKSREELYFSNTSKMANVSKSISIPNEEFSDDTTLKAAKFVRDFKSLKNKVDESLAKQKALEFEIEHLLRAVVSQDIMSIVQNHTVVETTDLQTELERTKERFENCIIRKENEYAKLWNDWYKKHTLDPLSQKLENENVELEFQVLNYAKDNAHLKTTYKNLINTFKTSREDKFVPINKLRARVRTNPIIVSQPYVITKKHVNSDSNGLSSIGVDNTAKTRRPQPRSNTKNDRVPSASKSSCIKNKEFKVEEHDRNLLLSKNKKHMSSECNNVKLDIQNDKSEVVCAMCKQCLINSNHDVCVLNYMNGMNSRNANHSANVSNVANQKKHKPKVRKSKKLRSKERLASPMPSKPRSCLRWSPTGIIFDLKGEIIASSESKCQFDCSNGDNACTFNPKEPTIKWFPNSISFLGSFGNDHVAAILGYDDLQWGNILITRVYFVEALGHNLFLVGQFCDSDLESWLWHQRLSHLNFDTINDLAKNDIVIGLPKFKYHKEHLCPLCEQGKSKRECHPPKPVPNSKQRLHLLHMYLCGPMRVVSINGKRYVLVIVDDYSCYTWVHFLRSKDEAPEVIKIFLKKITGLLLAPVIIIRTENDTEFKNQVLQEYFNNIGISHQASSVRTPQQNGVVEQRNRTLGEAARTIMMVKILESLVQKVILASSMVILLIPVLIESTTEGQKNHGDNECDI
ncbi:retrovirus-related pol polyprotein from transposon TNT 1-94 [Tanacetum coccineum]|uniref:Retrovirus-related pol polyprotein from transposon TNT 1-94 n=1 Tax=Tanacetum coccineum TaxID=301880 RepID=A0ABQ5IW01_9ASTR